MMRVCVSVCLSVCLSVCIYVLCVRVCARVFLCAIALGSYPTRAVLNFCMRITPAAGVGQGTEISASRVGGERAYTQLDP